MEPIQIHRKVKREMYCFYKKRKNYLNLAPIKLDGWVEMVTHLGCILEDDNLMRADIPSKQAQLIAKVNSLLQKLYFVDSSTMIGIIRTYVTSFYGSGLWNLCSNECRKLFNSLSVAMRNILNVNRKTHCHLIVPLSESIYILKLCCLADMSTSTIH